MFASSSAAATSLATAVLCVGALLSEAIVPGVARGGDNREDTPVSGIAEVLASADSAAAINDPCGLLASLRSATTSLIATESRSSSRSTTPPFG